MGRALLFRCLWETGICQVIQSRRTFPRFVDGIWDIKAAVTCLHIIPGFDYRRLRVICFITDVANGRLTCEDICLRLAVVAIVSTICEDVLKWWGVCCVVYLSLSPSDFDSPRLSGSSDQIKWASVLRLTSFYTKRYTSLRVPSIYLVFLRDGMFREIGCGVGDRQYGASFWKAFLHVFC